MDTYFGGIAMAVIVAVLVIMLRGRNAEAALAVSLCGCCLAVVLLIQFLGPVVTFIRELEAMMAGSNGVVKVLLKIVGIGFVGEIAALICSDSGNSALGKTVQMLTAGAILYLSLPVLTSLLELVEGMLRNT